MENHTTYYKTYSDFFDDLIVKIKNQIKNLPHEINDDAVKICCDLIRQMVVDFKQQLDPKNVEIVCSCLLVFVLSYMLKKYGIRIFRIILCSLTYDDIDSGIET